MCQHFSFVCLIHSDGTTLYRYWLDAFVFAGGSGPVPARCWVIVVDDGPAFVPALGQGFCLLMPALPGGAGSGPMLFCCWAGVLNGGPAVDPLWIVVSSFAGGSALDIFKCGRTRDVKLILVWRWSSFVDGGPTLSQR